MSHRESRIQKNTKEKMNFDFLSQHHELIGIKLGKIEISISYSLMHSKKTLAVERNEKEDSSTLNQTKKTFFKIKCIKIAAL